MIKINNNGNVEVRVSSSQHFDLSNSDEYTRFLLWITSPIDDDTIKADVFELDPEVEPERREELERYSLFFNDFLACRKDIINERKTAIQTADDSYKAIVEKLSAITKMSNMDS